MQKSVAGLLSITDLMPKVLAVDSTGMVVGRNWMIQFFLPGTPAPQRLSSFPKDTQARFLAVE
ncbi:hypothetical protein [Streptomyces sp. Wb2n-11]|uniref:hypothetical protein n=1 Tax=Streptomyces sp. Wb2n-11 TaxID=1030533 RepID=UPI0011478674|nr:hypothetical protein [Streptomyces sp. Wb2n-11]